MTSTDFDFAKIIRPINLELFFSEYWEKKPAFIQRQNHGFYDGLIRHQDMSEIISRPDARYPAVKLVKKAATYDEGFYSPELYTTTVKHGSDVFSGLIDTDKVISAYRSGASVGLMELHLSWEPLGELCKAWETFFSHAVRANAYITPGNSMGFPPHYDTHDVFVLQIGGRKQWRVYEAPVTLPLVSQPFGRQALARNYVPPKPLFEPLLEPGDLLYLPRGYVHAAATLPDSFSAHVTIGITPFTWSDLAGQMFMSFVDAPQFRGALPHGFTYLDEMRQVLKNGLRQMAIDLLEKDDFDKYVDIFINRARSSQSRNQGAFKKESFNCDVIASG